MRGLVTVLRKEVRENLRDRRALFNTVLILPLLLPVFLLGLSYFAISKMEERVDKPLELPIAGAGYAPNLVSFLKQQGVQVNPPVDDADEQVRGQTIGVAMEIPADFIEDWEQGLPATVKVITDPSRSESRTQAARLTALLNAYGRTVGSLRLQLRGVDPNLDQAILVHTIDLSTPKSRAMLIITALPYILMLTAFTGGLHLAIDTTAGEKERHSLEPLFITPVPRWQIMAGKMAATTLFALLSLTLTVISFKLTIPYMPIDQLGIDLNISVRTVAIILVIVMPVAAFAAALNTLLAAFAKSYREAQSYVGLVILIPMIPSIMFVVDPMKPNAWLMPIPIFSQNLLIGELVRGEPVNLAWLGISIAGTLTIGLLLAAITAVLYNRPRLVFGGS